MIEVSTEGLRQVCEDMQSQISELKCACDCVENISKQLMGIQSENKAMNTLCYVFRQQQKELEYQSHSILNMVNMLEMVADAYESCENKVCMVAENEPQFHNMSWECGKVSLRATAAFLKKWNL